MDAIQRLSTEFESQIKQLKVAQRKHITDHQAYLKREFEAFDFDAPDDEDAVGEIIPESEFESLSREYLAQWDGVLAHQLVDEAIRSDPLFRERIEKLATVQQNMLLRFNRNEQPNANQLAEWWSALRAVKKLSPQPDAKLPLISIEKQKQEEFVALGDMTFHLNMPSQIAAIKCLISEAKGEQGVDRTLVPNLPRTIKQLPLPLRDVIDGRAGVRLRLDLSKVRVS